MAGTECIQLHTVLRITRDLCIQCFAHYTVQFLSVCYAPSASKIYTTRKPPLTCICVECNIIVNQFLSLTHNTSGVLPVTTVDKVDYN